MTAPPTQQLAHLDTPGPSAAPDSAEPAIPRGADPETAILGPINGRYDLAERIAKGGMGIVYRAHDRLLNRTVAVKLMRGRYMDRADLLRRFLAEARINGRLQHPGVVPVYEVGTIPDGRPFIAMKLIEGRTLARLLRDRPASEDNLTHYLKVFEALCQTVAYAHQEGVIHRDLKPDNVMVGEFGEVQVMDWGLAKFLDPSAAIAPTPDGFFAVEQSVGLSKDGLTPVPENPTHATEVVPVGPDDPAFGYTIAGEVFGTLSYMPPEQARGEADKLDRRSDVFALGAILCELLTGQPPYFGPPELLKDMARGGKLFGAFVLLDRCGADRALIQLAKHCLQVEPDDRPIDAAVLAAMVTECLEGLQDRTRKIEMGRLTAEARVAEAEAREQLARRTRRLARMLAVAGVMVAGLLAAGLGWYAKDRSVRSAAEATRRSAALKQVVDALDEADALDDDARKSAGSPLVSDAAARRAWSACRRAEALFDATPNPPADLREWLDELKARVAQTERTTGLALAVERWRAELVDGHGSFDPARAAGKCREIAAVYGFNGHADAPVAEEEEWQRDPHEPIMRGLLVDWLAVTPDAAERQRLATILRAAGPPLPDALVSALDVGDPDTLAKLADELSDPAVSAIGLAAVACRLEQRNLTAAAERLLRRGARRYPNDYALNARLGTLLRTQHGNQADALRYLTAARAIRPADPIANLEFGIALADAGRFDEAVEAFQVCRRLQPTSAAIRAHLAKAHAARGESDAARTEYTAALLLDAGNSDARLGLGRLELAVGELTAAESAFRAATNSPVHSAAAHAGLGGIHLKRSQPANAAAAFRAAVECEPTNVEYRLSLVESLRIANDRAAAIHEAHAAANMAPSSAVVHKTLGDLLHAAEDTVGAVAAYRSAVRCDPADADAHARLAAVHADLRDWPNAARCYSAAADIRPKEVKLLIALAGAEELAGRSAAALEASRRAYEVAPREVEARNDFARRLALSGDESSTAELAGIADVWPADTEVRANLGESLLRSGQFRAAASTLRATGERLPADSARRANIEAAARSAARLAALEDRLSDLLDGRYTPSTAAGWAQMADVCRRTRRNATAARLFDRAAELDDRYAVPAAICAALAGFGRGVDVAGLSEQARAGLRTSALATLHHSGSAIRDPLLAVLKDTAFTADLTIEERRAWRAVWAAE